MNAERSSAQARSHGSQILGQIGKPRAGELHQIDRPQPERLLVRARFEHDPFVLAETAIHEDAVAATAGQRRYGTELESGYAPAMTSSVAS